MVSIIPTALQAFFQRTHNHAVLTSPSSSPFSSLVVPHLFRCSRHALARETLAFAQRFVEAREPIRHSNMPCCGLVMSYFSPKTRRRDLCCEVSGSSRQPERANDRWVNEIV